MNSSNISLLLTYYKVTTVVCWRRIESYDNLTLFIMLRMRIKRRRKYRSILRVYLIVTRIF